MVDCGARSVVMAELLDACGVRLSADRAAGADAPSFAIGGDSDDLSHPSSVSLGVGRCGSELAQPGLVVFDGLFGKEVGSLFDSHVPFGESNGHIGIIDPGGSGDESGNEAVGCSAPRPAAPTHR